MFPELGHWRGGTKGKHLKLHKNNGLELVVVHQGTMNWQVDGSPETVSAGNLFFTLPWQDHGSASAEYTGAWLSYVVIPVQGGPQDWCFSDETGLTFTNVEHEYLRNVFSSSQHAHLATERLIQNVVGTIDSAASSNQLLVRSLLQVSIVEAAHCITH